MVLAFTIWQGRRCGETCGDTTDWAEAMGSWQWGAQFVVPVLGFVALVAVVALATRGRYSIARLPLLGAALAFAAWAVFHAPLTSDY